MSSTKERIVVSVGGPLIVSDQIDTDFLKRFKTLGLEVAIINGTKLEEFSNYLDGKPFVGTVIS